MFHVKHRHRALPSDPAGFASAVREHVAGFLESRGFAPIPDFYDRIERFAVSIARWGARTNLPAAPDDPVEVAFHIIDSLAPVLIAPGSVNAGISGLRAERRKVLDLGAGAGFPGLILAAATHAQYVLLESRRRRSSFLQITAVEMGLVNAVIDPPRRDPDSIGAAFDVALGRAFAEPAVFYRNAAAALKPSGTAVLYASPQQPLNETVAEETGLIAAERFSYRVPRGPKHAERVLVLWRKRS